MGMRMRVATVHKIEYSSEKMSGYDDCQDFIDRLDNYAECILEEGTHENAYGEGFMEHEIQRNVLEQIAEQSDTWFEENGVLSDKEIIKSILKDADPDNDYVYLYCF